MLRFKKYSTALVFYIDDFSYVLVTLSIHPALITQVTEENIGATNGVNVLFFNNLEDIISYTNQATNGATNGAESILEFSLYAKVKEILMAVEAWIGREELFKKVGLTNQYKNRKKYLDPLLDFGWIEMKYPDNTTHPEQRYKISESGKRLLSLFN